MTNIRDVTRGGYDVKLRAVAERGVVLKSFVVVAVVFVVVDDYNVTIYAAVVVVVVVV